MVKLNLKENVESHKENVKVINLGGCGPCPMIEDFPVSYQYVLEKALLLSMK